MQQKKSDDEINRWISISRSAPKRLAATEIYLRSSRQKTLVCIQLAVEPASLGHGEFVNLVKKEYAHESNTETSEATECLMEGSYA